MILDNDGRACVIINCMGVKQSRWWSPRSQNRLHKKRRCDCDMVENEEARK